VCGREVLVKVRDVLKLIERDGWRLKRTEGSHRQFVHPVKDGKVTVSGHPSAEVAPKTLRSIERQAGLRNE
jgi:predicted RNA binding protein YcfA (HicA-like mRNA interferase family)